MSKMSEYQQLAIEKLHISIQKGQWSNESLVQLIELTGSYLNLKTIPDYAKENNLSYNGVKNFRNIVEIFNVKFVIDNQ
jgi:hypothetical protein